MVDQAVPFARNSQAVQYQSTVVITGDEGVKFMRLRSETKSCIVLPGGTSRFNVVETFTIAGLVRPVGYYTEGLVLFQFGSPGEKTDVEMMTLDHFSLQMLNNTLEVSTNLFHVSFFEYYF